MNIPESAIEPFGFIGMPTLVSVRMGINPELVTRVFIAIKETFRDARNRWRIREHRRKLGYDYSLWELDPFTLRIRAVLAGGWDVKCEVIILGDGEFYMSITFNVPGDNTRYGLSMDWPNGHNANV
jgi:hypothetical protein